MTDDARECAIEGCAEQRRVTAGGRAYLRCTAHWAEGQNWLCPAPGCIGLRERRSNGKRTRQCRLHMREAAHRHYEKTKAAQAALPASERPPQRDRGHQARGSKACSECENWVVRAWPIRSRGWTGVVCDPCLATLRDAGLDFQLIEPDDAMPASI